MNNSKSSITVLTCNTKGKKAVKKFIKHEDGSVKKVNFNAGKYFTYEDLPVSNLQELGQEIEKLSSEPRKFVIRGQVKEGVPRVVRRKTHDPDSAFDPVSRPYIMLDIDKLKCPDHFDVSANPEESVKWVLNALPKIFQDVSCYYRFSSSQNVPCNSDKNKSSISMHIWFWCARSVSDAEWKRYFKSESSLVDSALFSPVQIHYTATPVFENMDDPLPSRSGTLKGISDIVCVPKIPEKKQHKKRENAKIELVVSKEGCEEAIGLFAPYYKEGSRNRLGGAIASTLYRGGWSAENAADFIYTLAEKSSDDEADERYNNALRICDAVDNDLPAQGIPVLKEEFKIEEIDKILKILGLSDNDVEKSISVLNKNSDIEDIRKIMKVLFDFSEVERNIYLDKIKDNSGIPKSTLKALMNEAQFMSSGTSANDTADKIIQLFLNGKYQGGRCFLRSSDKRYWRYNGTYWDVMPEDFVKQEVIECARKVIGKNSKINLSHTTKSALNILEGVAFVEDDPFGMANTQMPLVMNCQNGELWFDENGDMTLKPHKAESYLRNCLNVSYDPLARCPMFDAAVLDIFSKSSDPKEMFRHFMELTGYICQPWRKMAIIVLLHGGGSNGKTSLLKIIQRMLGNSMVMADRISDIETSVFKIGDLDGKLMLLDDDVDGGTCLPDGFLKKISEEKVMTGQRKFKPPFEFICRAVPVMLANDYPVTKDLTLGIRRRLMVIPFDRTFESHEMKIGLFDSIWERESSGILNHVIQGFKRLKERGRFEKPKDCMNAEKNWIVRANILAAFIEEECEIGKKNKEHLGDFYDHFKVYCSNAGVRNPQGRRGVESRLLSLGYDIRILDGKKAVWGLRVASTALINGDALIDL